MTFHLWGYVPLCFDLEVLFLCPYHVPCFVLIWVWVPIKTQVEKSRAFLTLNSRFFLLPEHESLEKIEIVLERAYEVAVDGTSVNLYKGRLERPSLFWNYYPKRVTNALGLALDSKPYNAAEPRVLHQWRALAIWFRFNTSKEACGDNYLLKGQVTLLDLTFILSSFENS